jgi:HEAT repeat protein
VRILLLVVLCAGALVPLSGCGSAGPPTAGGKPIGYWVEALKDPDVRLRKKAVRKLANVGAADPAAVPALTGALKDRDAGVRAEAALALLRIGPEARDAVSALKEATKDRDRTVRSHATKALEKVQGSP